VQAPVYYFGCGFFNGEREGKGRTREKERSRLGGAASSNFLLLCERVPPRNFSPATRLCRAISLLVMNNLLLNLTSLTFKRSFQTRSQGPLLLG